MKKYHDVIFGAGVLIFATVFLNQLKGMSDDPAMFPKALLYVIFASGIGMIIHALRKVKKDGKADSKFSLKEFVTDGIIPGGLLLLMTWLMTVLGFYVGTFLVFMTVCVMQEVIITGRFRPTKKDLIRMLAVALVCTAVMYICFAVLLKLPTPQGPLGF